MTQEEKRLLRQAAKLTTLGVAMELERSKLKKLVEKGISYSSPEMVSALLRFEKISAEWSRLESEHLAAKRKHGE